MRRLLSLLALIFLCTWSSAQQTTFFGSFTQRNLQSCTFANSVVSGDTLIVGADTFGSLTGISSSPSETWTLVDSSTASGMISRVWKATANSSGTYTATVTGSSSFNGINCTELPQSAWTSTVDVHTNGGWSGSPATITTSAVTTTVNGDFLYCYVGGFQNAGDIQPSGSTLLVGMNNGADSNGIGYKVTGTNGSYSCNFNQTGNSQGNYVVLAFKPPSGITITTSALPTASLSNAYSYKVQEVGGVGAYTCSISSGSLPTGLSIGGSTCIISGTPTGGTHTFTVQVTDGTNTATRSFTLTVNSSASTPAFVQNSTGGNGLAPVSPATITAHAGNLNVVFLYVYAAHPIVKTPTDTLGTSYSFCGQSTSGPNDPFWLAIYVGTIPSTGTNVVSSGNNTAMGVDEFSGVQAFCDITASATGHSTGTVSSASFTTVAPNQMIVDGALTWTGTTSITAVSPFTGDGSALSHAGPVGEYNLESSTGTYTPTFSVSTTDDWALMGVALYPGTTGVVSSAIRHRVTQE